MDSRERLVRTAADPRDIIESPCAWTRKPASRTQVIIFLIVAILAPKAARDLSSKESDPSLPITVDDGGILAPVEVGAFPRPMKFLLDTGTETSVIDQATARSLHLQPGPEIEVLGAHGRGTAPTAQLEGLRIGPIQLPALGVIVVDLEILSEAMDSKVDGILGLDVLSQVRFSIDYAAKKLTLGVTPDTMDKATGSAIALRRSKEGYLVPVRLNNSFEHFILLDTGSNITQLPEHVWTRLLQGWSPSKTLSGVRSTGQGAGRSFISRLESLQLGAFSMKRPPVRVLLDAGPGAFGQPDAPGVLGSDILQRFRVAIDLSQNQLTLKPDPSYRPDPLRFTSVGIQIRRKRESHFVAGVWEGSPAHEAGIQVGNQIIEIDGVGVAKKSGTWVQHRLRGPQNSTITLRLQRGGKEFSFQLRRKKLL